MNSNEIKKKDWVKNAIIVFLTIMLLLTLFSNTITNYTLPQVSVGQVSPGTVSLAIRGSGTVEVAETYNVKATESRTILSVNVSKGDHVEFGDPIFYLQDEDSAELTKARDELATLELNYYKSLLTTKMTASAARNVNIGGASSFNTYVAKIDDLEQQIKAAEEVIKEKQQVVDNLKVGKSVEAIGQISQKYSANLEKNLASYAQEDAKTAFDNAKTNLKADLNNELANVKSEISKSSSTDEQMASYLSSVRSALNAVDKYAYPATTVTETDGKNSSTIGVLSIEADFNTILNNMKKDNDASSHFDPMTDETSKILLKEYENALSQYRIALSGKNSLEKLQKSQDNLTNAITAIDSVSVNEDGDYKAATERLRAATTNIDAVQASIDKTNANYDAASLYADEDLAKAQSNLKSLQDEMTTLVNDISNSLEADKTSDDIVRKKEEIAKLEAKAMGAAITAPVSGTIQSISKTAGEKISPDADLCVIIPDGKDLMISISVSSSNAKKINVGDTATLANSWAYPDAVCVVNSITDDPSDPANKSIIKFVITGDGVKIGQNMNLTLEADTKEYDKVIPNAALKHDNSGDFIYVLQEKSSPLGNRYYAKKVNVNKLASDDNKTAISGDVENYSSVITGSNKTPEAGKQVRLSESSAN